MHYTVKAKQYAAGRTTVMGIAAMLITWFHCSVLVDPDGLLGRMKGVSDIGVDLFLFASGVGLYFAVRKYDSYRAYLGARLRKVLIPYLLVIFLWSGYKYLCWGDDPVQLVKNILFVDFWLEGNLSSWYIAVILVLYLVTPAYVKAEQRYSWFRTAVFAAVVSAAVLVHWIPQLSHLGIAVSRLPVYLIGLWMGSAVKEGRTIRISVPLAVVCLLSGVLLVMLSCGDLPVTLPWGYKYIGYCPWAIGLSMLIPGIPQNRLTDYFGTRSLEIYLIFEKVLLVLANNPRMEIFVGSTAVVFNLIVLAVTLMLAEILHRVCKCLETILRNASVVDNLPQSR